MMGATAVGAIGGYVMGPTCSVGTQGHRMQRGRFA